MVVNNVGRCDFQGRLCIEDALQRSYRLTIDWTPHIHGGRCQKDIASAAAAVGVSVRTIRRYIQQGWLYPAKLTIPGGFIYRFSVRDIERARRVATTNLQDLAFFRPALCRWHVSRAHESGRSMPLSDLAASKLYGR